MAKKHAHKGKSSHKDKSLGKYNNWKIATAVLALLLLLSVFTNGFSFQNALSEEDAKNLTEAYLNKRMGGVAAVAVNEITEENGLYRLQLDVGGKIYDSYLTKNGRLLFPQAINMTQNITSPAEEQTQEAEQTQYPKSESPEVKLYTMSYCPYGNQAEEGIAPVAELLESDVEVEPHYVIYSDYRGGGPEYCLDDESRYCSMHGIQELNQNVREMCIYKYDKGNYWDYVLDVNDKCNYQNVDECWEGVAEEHSIDTEKIKDCEENEALDLLSREAELNKEHGVSGSPTLVINDRKYSGARTPEAYKDAICSSFTSAPESCAEELSSSGQAAQGSC